MLKQPFLYLALIAICSTPALAQAKYTASRAGDLQVGAGYSNASSDYVVNRVRGYAGYATFDFKEHYGAEFDYHQVSDPNSTVYERTYEWGGRYVLHYDHRLINPYVRIAYGRGVFNFPYNEANLAYNMMTAGGGVDISVHPRVNIRADFDYQDWFSGPGITNGLSPSVITIGAAYHFPAGRPH